MSDLAETKKFGLLQRDYAIPEGAVNVDARTVELSFSSEEPVGRWFGAEILDHSPKSVRLSRLNNGAALLIGHDNREQVGVVERAWIDSDRKGRAIVRFSKSARGEEILRDVADGIRKLASFGYRVHRMLLEEDDDGNETYRVMDWEPYEISLVPVPADPTVGVGRAQESQFDVLIERKEKAMTTEVKTPPAEVDVRVLENQVRDSERKRVREIAAMGKQFKLDELAQKHINEGTSVELFRELVLDALAESGKLKLAETPELGLSEKEARQYSFTRALLAIKEPGNKEAQSAAGFEMECSFAARKLLHSAREGGITVPMDMLKRPIAAGMEQAKRALEMKQQRDLTAGVATAGGHTVDTLLLASSFIDLLRNAMVVMQLGTTMLRDLNGNIAIPRQTGGATGFWVAENGSPTESEQTFDQVALSPKTVGAFTDYSRRLLIQSSMDVEAFVRFDLALIIALAIDLAAINGSGASNQPRGIINTSGIGSVAGGANGLAPTWDHIVDLETAVANPNALIGSLHYLTNTKVRGKLKKTQMFGGTNGQPVWDKDGSLNGYAPGVSNQVPSNLVKGASGAVCSAILFGNFADLLIGMWGGLDLMLDPYTGAVAGTKRIVALQDVDVSVRHAESFAAMLDALTT